MITIIREWCDTDPVTANCCQQKPFANTREIVKLSTKYRLAMIFLYTQITTSE